MIIPAEGDLRLDDEAATARLGAAIGRAVEAGEAVCLKGPLGAGKSVLARGLIRALSPAERDIPSPTFTLVQFYPGPRFEIAHFDLYRLANPEEAWEIGLDEALRAGAAVIEWPERLGHRQPEHRLEVEIEAEGAGEARRARLSPRGAWEGRPLISRREDERRAFLAQAGLGLVRRKPLAGDASTRTYERLYPDRRRTLILMDQAPRLESPPCPPHAGPAKRQALGYNALARLAAGRIEAFVAVAGYLRALGLSAPEVIACDSAQGFAVMEDLGDDLFARLTLHGADPAPLYDAAADVLVRLHEARAPERLEAQGLSWPLLDYDALALITAVDLFVEWLPRFDAKAAISDEALADWRALWRPIIAKGAAEASVFCHRDFHAENLVWLGEREGPARVGLLDFQDAVRAHPAWDLSMLLHDARRDIPPDLEARVLARYFAARPKVDPAAFVADFHALGALNILRILGLFARLIVRDAKPRYRRFMPRLWRYLDRCLADPALDGLADWLARHAGKGFAEARA